MNAVDYFFSVYELLRWHISDGIVCWSGLDRLTDRVDV